MRQAGELHRRPTTHTAASAHAPGYKAPSLAIWRPSSELCALVLLQLFVVAEQLHVQFKLYIFAASPKFHIHNFYQESHLGSLHCIQSHKTTTEWFAGTEDFQKPSRDSHPTQN